MRIYGIKYSWKSHKDTRNRQKNRKKGVGELGWFMSKTKHNKNINRNGPTTWRWARGDHKTRHFENLRTEQWAHPIYKTSTSSKQNKQKNRLRFCRELVFWWDFQLHQNTGNQLQSNIIYCERTSQRYYTLWSSQSENQLWCKQCTLVMVDIDETSKQNAGIY